MTISGFTIIRNGILFEYPFLESMRSLLPLVDELIVNVGISEDNTFQKLQDFSNSEGNGKIKCFLRDWELSKPENKINGLALSEQTNFALNQCKGDWCFYLQADEVLHEKDYHYFYNILKQVDKYTDIDCVLLNYYHFYGSYDTLQTSRSSYRREIRIFKNNNEVKSIGDAQSFRKNGHKKLNAVMSPMYIYHYGWVRTPEIMREKTFYFDQLYNGKEITSENKQPWSGDNYRYKRILGLKKFHGTHPVVMQKIISQKNHTWDFKKLPLTWQLSDLKKIFLDSIERYTGIRFFEYRNYKIISKDFQHGHIHNSHNL
ncbi:MAG: glycosyltransferase family 2 protein [Deltaproteobacteria bacterium]|nr:glycosyltransferase family 2 protein [Deltaproteobacteria bacterium]